MHGRFLEKFLENVKQEAPIFLKVNKTNSVKPQFKSNKCQLNSTHAGQDPEKFLRKRTPRNANSARKACRTSSGKITRTV